MTPEYLSAFPPGLGDVVGRALIEKDPDASLGRYDGSVIFFSSRLSPEQVQNLPFFQNAFLVLSRQQFSDTSNLPRIVESLFNNIDRESTLMARQIIRFFGWRSFRFRVSEEGELRPISPKQMNRLERVTSKSLGVQVNRSKPDFEIWFLIRRSGESYYGLRLTNDREKRERGELSREISYLLNFISQPKPQDVFLDPFAGSGAILLSRAKHFAYKEIIGMDIDPKGVEVAKRRLRKFPGTRVMRGDALQMKEIRGESVDVIVTDPPWGIFKKFKSDPRKFYYEMLREMRRVLRSKGRLVILTAARDEMEEAIENLEWLPNETFDILVSGRKAGVYYFIKP